ncbi:MULTISPECIES: FxSxx-COOH cyclophane-containing RiPP peptide [Streptomyces]|uniref:FxSxx-COOH cyclophane-containing RiPP peptide n=1 Tax=Streptomyces TaxID=1883 RepID=UPI0006289260|nr:MULTISPECIES: FxSxx-COOH cyclophane-containing RiPP peptide [Streptomyces]MCG7203432.1 FxSxx-COOH protein [Streptomyces arenae]
MDARDRALPEAGAAEPLPDLPDLLELDLGELKEVDHPVLRQVLAELTERAARPTEMLWGFNNSF